MNTTKPPVDASIMFEGVDGESFESTLEYCSTALINDSPEVSEEFDLDEDRWDA